MAQRHATKERFAKYVPLLMASIDEAIDKEIAETNKHPCGVCRKLLGEHNDAQVFVCAKKLHKLSVGGTP